MKLCCLLFGLLVVSGVSAQTSPNSITKQSAPVTVLENSWREEVFIPALYDDPMRANQDAMDLMRDQRATERENATRARSGENAIPLPTKKVASNTPVGSTPMGVPIGDEPIGNKNQPAAEEPGLSSKHYLYEIKIKNTSEKSIKSLIWEYSLFEGDAQEPVGTHRFSSVVTIQPGRTLKLMGRSKTPPARVINAAKSSNDSKARYTERVTVSQITYADGTVWQAP